MTRRQKLGQKPRYPGKYVERGERGPRGSEVHRLRQVTIKPKSNSLPPTNADRSEPTVITNAEDRETTSGQNHFKISVGFGATLYAKGELNGFKLKKGAKVAWTPLWVKTKTDLSSILDRGGDDKTLNVSSYGSLGLEGSRTKAKNDIEASLQDSKFDFELEGATRYKWDLEKMIVLEQKPVYRVKSKVVSPTLSLPFFNVMNVKLSYDPQEELFELSGELEQENKISIISEDDARMLMKSLHLKAKLNPNMFISIKTHRSNIKELLELLYLTAAPAVILYRVFKMIWMLCRGISRVIHRGATSEQVHKKHSY